MNLERKYISQSKRLEKANQRIDELQTKLENNKSYYEEKIEKLRSDISELRTENDRIVPLMAETEELRKKWKKSISDLNDKQNEYQILIYQLKKLKKELFK